MRHPLHIAILVLLASCTVSSPLPDTPVGQPVLFSVAGEHPAQTKSTSYMAPGRPFVCSMYYHAAYGDTDESPFDVLAPDSGTMTTAWLKVTDEAGGAQYWDNAFTAALASPVFYWQNRLNHAFLALADYNQLTELKMYPNGDTEEFLNTYDLTRGTRESIDGQPDPILALTVVKPVGATPDRVQLTFHHQFSRIRVNVKGATDNSATLAAGQIESVELVGVSTEGYVYNHLNSDGTVGATTANEVDADTAFQLFEMDSPASGYLKSFNGIAFGILRGIRITWHEADNTSIKHTPTLVVSGPLTLASGREYEYNLELRRGGLTLIQTQVQDWGQKEELVYSTSGSIH